MDAPLFLETTHPAPSIDALASAMPVPGMGVLPINAFIIHADEPVLVDAGLPALATPFLEALSTRLDLADLRWIWLTHADADHLGALDAVLEAAPQARIVTNFLGMGKLMMQRPIDPARFHLVHPGQALDVGDRELLATVPAVYDAPETMGLFDPRTRALFSSDCFGALLDAPALDAGAVDDEVLERGLVTWAGVDAPWLSLLTADALFAALEPLRRFAPEVILSAHLPPARGMTERLTALLEAARHGAQGSDQAALGAA